MTEKQPGISIEQDGDEWIIRRRNPGRRTTSLRLSAANLLSLVEAAPHLQKLVTSQLPGAAGANAPVFAVPIVGVDLGTDVLGNLLIEVALPNGLHSTYSLPAEKAGMLGQMILEVMARARNAIHTKQ